MRVKNDRRHDPARFGTRVEGLESDTAEIEWICLPTQEVSAFHRLAHCALGSIVYQSSGSGDMNRRSTLPVMRATLLSYPLCDRAPVQAIEPVENTAPPPARRK